VVTNRKHKTAYHFISFVLLLGLSGTTEGVDGTILISQSKAATGNVTAGDAPGFPVTLSRGGSYCLSGNLTVPDNNTKAIEIISDNVTLDLNGFTISNAEAAAYGSGAGISGTTKINITVMNGSVRGMGNFGIALGHLAHVERVQVIGNSGVGIYLGTNSIANNNIVNGNGGGIVVGEASIVTGNTVRFNKGNGIQSWATGGLVSGNISNNNEVDGITVYCPSTVIGNTAIGNGVTDIPVPSTNGTTCVFKDNAKSL
jgi:hypothetical protein